ncbi:LysR family transcriptional regulator [Amorphus sp. 3PC139-8]|uniref:LysR family transcriptional regulator n=1 Tax=Amorphus sp. 3PC139-8 TaxID=2735676 RepID=UPI00345C82D7
MNDLKPFAVFAETVSAGSMSGAARRLGMSPSAVSQTISALEKQTGVALLHRSTRKLSLTEAGERCYPHCLQLLAAANAAKDSLAQARDAPVGELRISAPLGFAPYIAPALAPTLADWPNLTLSLIVDDAMIDLVAARIDIALRVGQLADSEWITRKLCDFETVLCAAPAYLERHGIPLTKNDLDAHQWIAVSPSLADTALQPGTAPPGTIRLNRQTQTPELHLSARITCTNQVTARQMCEQGAGMAQLVYTDVLPSLESGTLVRVLPDWRSAPVPVMMVLSPQTGRPAKVRIATEALARHFASLRSCPPDPDGVLRHSRRG